MKANHTIKDIAEKAEVSIGTVDRVLHERGRVSKVSKEKVMLAIKELEYQPDPIARTLKNSVVHKVGVLLPNPEYDSFWQPCDEGIREVISEFKAFKVEVVMYYFNPFKPKSFSQQGYKALRDGIHALFLAPLFEREANSIIEKFRNADVLLASFNSLPTNDVHLYVGQDLVLSGKTAARLLHMVTSDLSKVAIIHINEPYDNSIHLRQKEEGFRLYCTEKGVGMPFTLTLKTEELKMKLLPFIEKNKDLQGIFVTTSKAYEVAGLLDLTDNKGISLVGYDLLEQNLKYLEDGVIDFLIHQSPKIQASQGVKYLIENLLFKKEFPKEKLLPISIVNSENVKSYLE